MPEKPETDATDAEVTAIVTTVITKVLDDLGAELGHPLSATVEVVKDGVILRSLSAVRSRRDGDAQPGTVRLRFRATSDETRRLFFLDSVFDHRTPAFSGFMVRGQVRTEAGVTRADYKTWVVKRNDSDWAKWL